MRLAFAGTPATALPSLQALLESKHEVAAVITRPRAPAGRGRRLSEAPVEQLARDAGVPVFAPDRPSDPDFLTALSQLQLDCCPVVAYGALIGPAALDVPVHGWVNLHFSLLPAWRGAAPVQHAILHGDDITGASTFQIEAGLDTGPVFGVVTEAIRADDTAGTLLERLAGSGAALLVATMDGIDAGALHPVPQARDGVSIAGKITVADAHIDWRTPAMHVDRLIRACTPSPGPWTTFRGTRLKLGPVRRAREATLLAGQISAGKRTVRVGTGTTEVELSTVQPAGGRLIDAAEWARGARIGVEAFA